MELSFFNGLAEMPVVAMQQRSRCSENSFDGGRGRLCLLILPYSDELGRA